MPELQTQEIDLKVVGEMARFRTILRRHVQSRGASRRELRNVLYEYLAFSPQTNDLMNELIMYCIDLAVPQRLDVAIDILSQLNGAIYDYAWKFLMEDINHWSNLYPDKMYKPNDDYWYILLRSVAQSNIPDDLKLRFVSMCSIDSPRGILEGVVEALGDIDTESAREELKQFCDHQDQFVAELASEILAQN